MIEFKMDGVGIISDPETKTYWVSGFVELFYKSGRYEKVLITGGVSAVSKAIVLFDKDDSEERVSDFVKDLIIRALIREIKRREVANVDT